MKIKKIKSKRNSKIYLKIKARKYGKFHSFFKKGEFFEIDGKLIYFNETI